MTTRTYAIEGPWPGQLAIIGRPRGGDWLDDDVRALRSKFDVLVSMLCADEARELDLDREAEAAAAAGLRFVSFPVPDRSFPDRNATRPVFEQLLSSLRGGARVAVHCRMGIGRSGLVCGALLVLSGTPPDEAWARVRAARGVDVPDTPEQREWVARLAESRP